jgi:hypothetical protein
MPNLLTLIPCEKVLLDSMGQMISLITVLTEIHIGLSTDAPPIMPNSATPFRWAIFTEWEREEKDVTRRIYEQQLALTSPSDQKDVFFSNVQQFLFENDAINSLRLIGHFQVFPLLPAGRYELVARWRQHGSETWNESRRYTVRVVYDSPPVPSPVTAPKS